MARYAPAIRTSSPEAVKGQPGQWIDYEGTRGRLMGTRRGVSFIAWGRSATHRFSAFAASFNATT